MRVILAALVWVAGSSAAQAGVHTFAGRGARVIGPLPIAEGTLQLRLEHRSRDRDGRFAVRLLGDVNRDGRHDPKSGDPSPIALHDSKGAEAGAVSTRIRRRLTWSGSGRIAVNASGRWVLTLWQAPAPGHRIRGRVIDGSERPVAGAAVVLTAADGSTTRAVADDRGAYSVAALGGRTYRVEARAGGLVGRARIRVPGFRPLAVARDIRVAQPRGLDVSLEARAEASHVLVGQTFRVRLTAANRGRTAPVLVTANTAGLDEAFTIVGRSDPWKGKARRLAAGKSSSLVLTVRAKRAGRARLDATLRFGANKRRRARVELEATRGMVSGRVIAIDHQGQPWPIADVPVTVAISGAQPLRGYSDSEGFYVVTGVDAAEQHGKSYSVQVTLSGRCGKVARCLEVQSSRELTGKAVHTISRGVVRGPREVQPVRFGGRVARAAAVHYSIAHRALAQARDELGMSLDAHPLTVRLHAGGDRSHYTANTIWSSDRMSDLGTFVPDVLLHELGHHVHHDIAMGGNNAIPALRPGDVNHGGAKNADSTDSVTEGFATFFSCLLRSDPLFRQSGTRFALNLERNSWYGTGWEEMFVAGLLWDLIDQRNESGDQLALDSRRLMKLLDSPSVTTVRALYRALQRAGVRRAKLDQLFVLHKFFGERSTPYRKFNGSDQPGWADYFSERMRNGLAPRHTPPIVPGGTLRYSVVDGGGAPVTAHLVIRVSFPAGQEADDYSYVVAASQQGSVELYVPRDAERLTITPVAVGYWGAPLELAPRPFWAAVQRARKRGAKSFATHRFRMRRYRVPPPRRVSLERAGAGTRVISWSAPDADEVIVVRRADRPPTSPFDGVQVYRGIESRVVDTVMVGVGQHYALFSIRDTSPSAPAVPRPPPRAGGGLYDKAPKAAEQGDEDAAERTVSAPPGARRLRRGCCDSGNDAPANVLLAGLVLLLILRRRRLRSARAPACGGGERP